MLTDTHDIMQIATSWGREGTLRAYVEDTARISDSFKLAAKPPALQTITSVLLEIPVRPRDLLRHVFVF